MRTATVAIFLTAAFSLVIPTTAQAFSLTDIPFIGKYFAVPKVSNLSITSQVRLDDEEWSDTIPQVSQDQVVHVKIAVSNSSDAIFKTLRVINITDSQLTSEMSTWDIDQLGRKEKREILFDVITSDESIPPSESLCVHSVANLIYQDERVASDVSSVCIAHTLDNFGEVLGVGNIAGSLSPQTGLFDVQSTVTIPLLIFSFGCIAYLISLFIERRLNQLV